MSPAAPPAPRSAPGAMPAWLRAALLLAAVAFVFGASVRGGWLWDDNQEVTENAVLRDPGGLGPIWSGAAGADYFPLKTTLQWFEWRLWGADPAGYHAVSVALHALGALLFWAVLARLGLRLAWLGGLLFAVHPLTVESVAWAAELKNTLSLPLLLGAALAYLEFDARRGRGAYAAALGLFLLAMLAKSTVVMFPAAILLHAWWRRGRIGRADLLAAAPFLGVSAGLGLVTVWFQHHRAMQPDFVVAGGFVSRLGGAGRALAFYLGKSLLPIGLVPIYPRWSADPLSAAPWLAWAGLLALGALLWARRGRWGRGPLFGYGFFVLNLLPVAGLITNTYMHITWVADHLAYLPLLGVIGLAAAAAERLKGGAALLAVLAVALAGESRAYAAVFHDEDTLWTYTLGRNPDAWSAHYNLATWLARRGQLARADGEFRATLRLRPAFAEAHFNYGNTLFLERRAGDALAEYREAVRLEPGRADFHVGLGNALYLAGRPAEAAAEFEEALRLRPGDARIQSNLDVVRRSLQP
jgi:tetratricopeptide (TPR) repeat protein